MGVTAWASGMLAALLALVTLWRGVRWLLDRVLARTAGG